MWRIENEISGHNYVGLENLMVPTAMWVANVEDLRIPQTTKQGAKYPCGACPRATGAQANFGPINAR
jgi:hypothetical protein